MLSSCPPASSALAAPLPSHLLAPPPREGLQRRPIHLDAVRAANARGSVWEEPPPAAAAADTAAAIRVGALDRLFAKPLPGAGSPHGSPQRPAQPAASSGSAGDGGGDADCDACSVCSSPGRLASRGSLVLSKRPIIRLFTGGAWRRGPWLP